MEVNIPTVTISRATYEKYCFNDKYLQDQYARYSCWLNDFSKSGEAALPFFTVSDGLNTKMHICGVKSSGTGEYGVMVYLYTQKAIGLNELIPLIAYTTIINNRFVDLYVDIPENDETWAKIGVHSLQDLPYQIQNECQRSAQIASSIFAKVQNDAFKCQHKIIRLKDKVNNPSTIIQGEPLKDSEYKPISLSPGITVSYQSSAPEPRVFIRHCEAWGVRGHYRHYKNGKTVFIAPYIKGSGRMKKTEYND